MNIVSHEEQDSRRKTLKFLPQNSFISMNAGTWLIHHLGDVALGNEELWTCSVNTCSLKLNKILWNHLKCILTQNLRNSAFSKACILPALRETSFASTKLAL